MKMSQYSYEQELDFNEARADLDSVLQNIVAKANAGDSSPASDKINDIENMLLQSDKNKTISDSESPQKSSSRSTRKRRRKDDNKEEKQKANSCVMKLFDRSVDLAQFSEDTPLYPICRAWMSNDPYTRKVHGIPSDDLDEASVNDGNSEEPITIPPPNTPFKNFSPNGKYVSARIPSPIPQPSDRLEDYLQQKKVIPRAETLLLNHLQHWKNVREKWIAKSAENEERYSSGMALLKDMANRQLCASNLT
uniref:protein lin-37 homolog n=1 Tax=Styela clava TaxID=7725 RepID=UPI00193A846C|nr:protein lin-37 homolog [Styela clava]